ncbi:hypothetical protein AAAC11_00145 [Pseudomonas aeruginosa]|uniref:hypothetical protein n=1 Tax=Pseudomonas aeruginosa TaxID=287 RepID=UPI0030F19381
MAGLYQLEPAVGLLFVSAPLLVIAGLPAWWLIGAALRLFERDGDSWLGAFAQWVKRKLENTVALQPRGIRNNNPGNIVWSARNNWQGPNSPRPADRAALLSFRHGA